MRKIFHSCNLHKVQLIHGCIGIYGLLTTSIVNTDTLMNVLFQNTVQNITVKVHFGGQATD